MTVFAAQTMHTIHYGQKLYYDASLFTTVEPQPNPRLKPVSAQLSQCRSQTS
jgi:hypothetical protein